MSDPTFDAQLAERLRRYGDRGVDPFDPLAIAEAAIADQPTRRKHVDLRLLAVAAVLVVAGGVAAALAAGSRPSQDDAGAIVIAYSDGRPGALRSALRVDAASGATTEVVRGQTKVSLAPDGRHVVSQAGTDVHLVDAQTGAEVVIKGSAAGRLRSPDDEGGATDDTWHDFVWSPGGRWVSWIDCSTSGCLGTLEATDGSRSNRIPRGGPNPVPVAATPGWAWLDDDHLLVFGHGQHLYAHTWVANGDGSGARACTSQDDCHVHYSGWGIPGATETVDTPDGITIAFDGRWAIAGFSTTPDDTTGFAVLTAAPNDRRTRPSKARSGWSGRMARRRRWTSDRTSRAPRRRSSRRTGREW